MPEPVIRRALISVSDKGGGLVEFARFLHEQDVEILSTGGTAKMLADAGVPVVEVGQFTGFPEMLDGRVKTLHPRIHGGLLGIRGNAEHEMSMKSYGILAIDLAVVNLYPFEATVAKGADFETCIENIDIGGPAVIRGAAKNHEHVAVVVNPEDYQAIIEEMGANGGATTLALRRRLAAAAYALTAAYDTAISVWFAGQNGDELPLRMATGGKRSQMLRYGENPHQKAALYLGGPARPGVATSRQMQGKELSYNNIGDTDAAFELVSEFAEPAVAIIKHANPCGAAIGADLVEAFQKALLCDSVSAYGGIVAVNRPLDGHTAAEIAKLFTEVVIAPEADAEALEIFGKKKNLRLLLTGGMPDPRAPGLMVRSVAGGFLAQTRDGGHIGAGEVKTVSKRAPSPQELADLLFAFTICKHVKSNAIVFARGGATVGIGAGQMSRVDSSRIAAMKAADAAKAAGLPETLTKGSVVASDAFFPFADGLIAAFDAGATAAIHPGGSIRDGEVTNAADERGMALLVTGMRHFRH